MYVFVHGTLKKSEPNNYYLFRPENGRCSFVGKASLVEKYPLIIASRYNIPYVLDAAGKGDNIEGELYEVDEQMIQSLDQMEEVPQMCTRRLERVSVAEQQVEAWVYFLQSFHSELLRSKCYRSYSSTDAHRMPYVPMYNRDQDVDHRVDVKYFI